MPYYNFPLDLPPKEWNNECPECGSIVKWGLHSREHGAKASVHCSNSIFVSREFVIPLEDNDYCMWSGYVVRQRDGGVRFRNKDGQWIKEIIVLNR
jgi:hypothetical protein